MSLEEPSQILHMYAEHFGRKTFADPNLAQQEIRTYHLLQSFMKKQL